MRTSLAFLSVLFVGAAGAAEFAHPYAEAVALMGKGTAQVCYNQIVPRGSGQRWEWACENVGLNGPRAPSQVNLTTPGPVVVLNARWAFALGECQESELDLSVDYVKPDKRYGFFPMPDLSVSGTATSCRGWVPLEAGEPMN